MSTLLLTAGGGFSWGWIIIIVVGLASMLFLSKLIFGWVMIGENEVGIVNKKLGKSLPDGKIIALNGEAGWQATTLSPGLKFWYWPWMYTIKKEKMIAVPDKHIAQIEAIDGIKLPPGRNLADYIQCDNFQDATAFLNGKGQKGQQLGFLMPGTYRINTALFRVNSPIPWTEINADEVGIVTVQEGKSIQESGSIAAKEVDGHNNFQDPEAFIKNDGEKGLQIPVLRAGAYAINPWFATVKKVDMIQISIGECGVVTSFVGEEGTDVSDENVNAKIVDNGKKGIWKDPLGPGKHPLNTEVCKVDIVPTTQILLNWADNRSSAHDLDSNLKTITLRTSDAFDANMDVSVIIHIAMKDAPKVIANLGSVKNLIAQVLEPAISSHFRNAAQAVKALELYTQRKELQETAKEHIQTVLRNYHVESKDTMIADVVLPKELTKTITDRQIAEQEKATYGVQKQAQDERKALANATAQANMQDKVVESERQVDIAQNKAKAVEEEAKGKAKAIEIEADANAKATKLNADADAEKVKKVGTAEAEIIKAKGESTAEAYEKQVKAMGEANFANFKIMEIIGQSGIKLTPDILINGGGNGGSSVDSLVAIQLMDFLQNGRKGLPAGDKKDAAKDNINNNNNGGEQAAQNA